MKTILSFFTLALVAIAAYATDWNPSNARMQTDEAERDAVLRTGQGVSDLANAAYATFSQTLQCDITGAYAVNDLFCNMITLTNALRRTSGYAELQDFAIYNKDDTAPILTALVFSRPFTVGATNAAFGDTNALTYLLGSFKLVAASYIDIGTAQYACATNIGIVLNSTYTNRNIYIGILAGDTTQITNQPVVKFGIKY